MILHVDYFKITLRLNLFLTIKYFCRYLQDPHPRVRYAACNAVGQMSTDFASIFQKKFHDRVIPGLLMLLDDNGNPRVQAHAGTYIVNYNKNNNI